MTERKQEILLRAITREFDSCFSDPEEFKANNPGKKPEDAFLDSTKWLLGLTEEEIVKNYGEDIGQDI